jgi:hypothetical protein
VRRLANPDMMIEIEADAYAGTANSHTAGSVVATTAPKPPMKSAKKPASKKHSRRK